MLSKNLYWKLFIIFAKIGAFTLGGGVAMIPLIEREVVYRHKWIDDEDFLDMISIAQSAPGLIAVNVAIFIGHRIAGIKGSIVATIGSIVPLHDFQGQCCSAGCIQGYSSGRRSPHSSPGHPHGGKEPAQLDNRYGSRCRHRPHRVPEDLPHMDHSDGHIRRPDSGIQPTGQAQA